MKQRDSKGRFKKADRDNDWRDLDFWNDVKPYYETHTRSETAEHFGILDQDMKSMTSFYNYKKPWNNIRKCKNNHIYNSLESVDWDEYLEYYQTHTQKETCLKFNVSVTTHRALCKLHNYSISRDEIERRILSKALSKRDLRLSKLISNLDTNKFIDDYYKMSRDNLCDKYNLTNMEFNFLKEYYNLSKTINQIRSSSNKRYTYNSIRFDSLQELAFYIYYYENGFEIEVEPIKLTYYFDNTERVYIPDFKLFNELIEIKGDHFFKEDGTMCNPFDHSQDGIYEAKHQCALNNGVRFILSSECGEYIDYCENKYGKKWYTLYRNR